MKWFILAALTSFGTTAAAQRPPVIPQPTVPAGLSGPYGSGTRPPAPTTRRQDPASRAARSDTTEIRQVVARRLSMKARDLQDAEMVIQKDTAWVTLMDWRFRGSTLRVERHHTWKVVDPD